MENCRGCGAKFQLPLLKRKHHCRICAGVFCDSCCMYTPDTNGQSSPTTNNNKPNILSKFGKGRLGENNQVSKFSKSKEIVDENNSNMRTCNGKYIIISFFYNFFFFFVIQFLVFFVSSVFSLLFCVA